MVNVIKAAFTDLIDATRRKDQININRSVHDESQIMMDAAL